MDNEERLALGISEAAASVGLGRSSIYKAISNGLLKTRKAGRRTIIEPAELKRFISSLPHNQN